MDHSDPSLEPSAKGKNTSHAAEQWILTVVGYLVGLLGVIQLFDVKSGLARTIACLIAIALAALSLRLLRLWSRKQLDWLLTGLIVAFAVSALVPLIVLNAKHEGQMATPLGAGAGATTSEPTTTTTRAALDATTTQSSTASIQPATATTTSTSRQWALSYKDEPIRLRDSNLRIDFDVLTVRTENFPGADLRFTELGGDTWTDVSGVAMGVHNGPDASAESCEKALQTGPMTSTYLRTEEPYLCVRTNEGNIAFITVLESITDYRATVRLWRLS